MIENLKNLLIIDDLDPRPIIDLVSYKYPKTLCTRLVNIEAIKEYLIKSAPGDSGVLLNAHVRFNDGDLRSNFLGMRFLRQEFRAKWRRKEAVIVYSPIPPETFRGIPINRILSANVGHYFYHIIKQKSIFDIIRNASPIESEAQLDDIIQRYGCLSHLIRTFKHDIENQLSDRILQANHGAAEHLEELVYDLANLIPSRLHEPFKVDLLQNQTQDLVRVARNGSFTGANEHINVIRSLLDTYSRLCNKYFSAC